MTVDAGAAFEGSAGKIHQNVDGRARHDEGASRSFWDRRGDREPVETSVQREREHGAASPWRRAAKADRWRRGARAEEARRSTSRLDGRRAHDGACQKTRRERELSNRRPSRSTTRVLGKKKTILAAERDRADVLRRREEYVRAVSGTTATRLVFVDETGTHVEMTRLYSRATIGQRAYGKVSRRHRVNLTVVGAIALDGVRAMMAYEGGTTREAFIRFTREALVPALKRGDVVVMDNLRAHYAHEVQDAIKKAGASVLYLPPYSPELNPIELTWSKLKAILRRIGARTLHALAGALPECCSAIRLSDLYGWFKHAGALNQPNG